MIIRWSDGDLNYWTYIVHSGNTIKHAGIFGRREKFGESTAIYQTKTIQISSIPLSPNLFHPSSETRLLG